MSLCSPYNLAVHERYFFHFDPERKKSVAPLFSTVDRFLAPLEMTVLGQNVKSNFPKPL